MEEIEIKNIEEMEKYFHKDRNLYLFKEGNEYLDVYFDCDVSVDANISAGNIGGENIRAENIYAKGSIDCDLLEGERIQAENIYAHQVKFYKMKIENELSSTFILGGDIMSKNIIADLIYAGEILAINIKSTNIISTENIKAKEIKGEGFVCAYKNISAEIREGGNLFGIPTEKRLTICDNEGTYNIDTFEIAKKGFAESKIK